MTFLARTFILAAALSLSLAVFAFAGGEKEGGVTSAGHDHANKVYCLIGMQVKPRSELPSLKQCGLTETQYVCAEKLLRKGYPAETVIRECLK